MSRSMFSAMGNPLLAIRFVFLANLIILSVFMIVFAIWNVNASSSTGLNVSITTVLFFINAIATFIFVALGVADFAVPERHLFPLWVECVFSAIIACLEMGTSIGATAQAANICKWDVTPGQCTSIVLLLPVGWMGAAAFAVHCLSVIVFTASRSDREPDVWSSSMCSKGYLTQECANNGSMISLHSNQDVELQIPKHEKDVAPWAPMAQNQIRRGRDAPFELPTPRATPVSTPRTTPIPPAPPRVHFRSESAEAYGGYVRPTHAHHTQSGSQSSLSMSVDSFPARVRNADAPIPLPDRSEWVRADPRAPIYSKFATMRPDSRRSLPMTYR